MSAKLLDDATRQLIELGVLRDRAELLAPSPPFLERVAGVAGDVLGFRQVEPHLSRISDQLNDEHQRRLKERVKLAQLGDLRPCLGRHQLGGDRGAHETGPRAKAGRSRASIGRTTGHTRCRSRSRSPIGSCSGRRRKATLRDEMSTALQMPGWGNSFTQPIANRIEMLSTGVRLPVAVKVFGSNLDDIQRVSRQIADVLRGVRGAADVFADQIIGKGYVEIKIDRKKAARYGLYVGDIQDVSRWRWGARPLTMTVEGRQRYPVRVRYARDYRDDVEALKGVLVSARGMALRARPSGDGRGGCRRVRTSMNLLPLRQTRPRLPCADSAGGGGRHPGRRGAVDDQERERIVAVVHPAPRPRSRRGGVRGGSAATRRRQGPENLPAGMYIEWTGTFEHQVRANKTLRIVFPAVIAVIMLILYLTHKNWTDALLMMTSVLGALAGGAIFQWLFGFNFSVAVQVGYIACFGMAVETGVVMLVYLREAIDERGGLEQIGSIGELRAGDPGRSGAPAAAQAAHGRSGDSLDRPDALGNRCRLRGDPPDGGAGSGRALDRGRGDRRVPSGALLRREEARLDEAPPRSPSPADDAGRELIAQSCAFGGPG